MEEEHQTLGKGNGRGRIWHNCLCLCAAPAVLLLGFCTDIYFFFVVQTIIQGSLLVLSFKIAFLPRNSERAMQEQLISLWVGCAVATGFIYYIWANSTSFR